MTSDLFGKVAVLLGGNSAEREVSLKSGEAVYQSLLAQKLDVIKFDPKERDLLDLQQEGIHRVWIALHGRGGEDGTLQAVLESMNIGYTGSGVLGSALAMDKWRSKMIWKACGLSVAAHALVTTNDVLDEQMIRKLYAKLGPTLFVKPSHEGSSVGMSKVKKAEELKPAIESALKFDSEVLVERFIDGKEYTVSILNGVALPSISMVTPREFYDYEAKYQSTETQYFCPSGLTVEEESKLGKIALKAFNALSCGGWGRIDFIRDKHDGEFKVLEANTVPGMTKTSLVPKAAKQNNMSFDELTLAILQTSF